MKERPSVASEQSAAVQTGQILILFALFLTTMLGILGLSVDLGISFAERRAMQNAADAGALAGATTVSKSTSANPLSAQGSVEIIAGKNAMRIGAIDQVSCSYVNDSDTSLGSCSGTVPATASGVTVTVYETNPTYFIRAIPGGPTTARISATATAHVRELAGFSDGPFIVCGSQDPSSAAIPPILKLVSGVWTINPAAVGTTFQIHGPQINDCAAKANRFKGLSDQDANAGLTAPNWFGYDTGVKAGPTRSNVDGLSGCASGDPPDECVLILPIAIDNPAEQGNSKSVWVVAFAPFYVTQTGANTHSGKLLSNYIIYGSGQTASSGWFQGYTGPIAVKLTS